MTDFVEYRPRAHSSARNELGPAVTVRAAVVGDARELAAVMSARGGTIDEHVIVARRTIDRLPVLLVAETAGGLVGWSGAQRIPIRPEVEPEWLIAGLTVVPEQRRRGIAARLLGDVVVAVRSREPGAPVFSAVNVRNLASIELHRGVGFREVARGATFAGIDFTGGQGVLLRHP